MPTQLDASLGSDVPKPTVELEALSVFVEAYIEVEGREKGQALLAAAARIMSLREELETVVEFLPPKQLAERAAIRRQTAAWFRRSLARWLTRLAR